MDSGFDVFLDLHNAAFPRKMFETVPSKDSIPVRRFTFALETMITQLKNRVPESTQKLMQTMVYKFSGPQRHQGFWKKFRHMNSLVKKYNQLDILKLFNDLHSKVSSQSTYFYMPSNETIRHIAALYLSTLYRLCELKNVCVELADCILGQLEIGHWESFSVFIVALCAEITYIVPTQTKAICDSYAGFSEFVRSFDPRFPVAAVDSVQFIPSMLSKQNVTKKSMAFATNRLMFLLKMTDDKMDDARRSTEMDRIRKEMMAELGMRSESVDIGVAIERDVIPEKVHTESFGSPTSHLKNDSIFVPSSSKSRKKKLKKVEKVMSANITFVDLDSTAATDASVFDRTAGASSLESECGLTSCPEQLDDSVLCGDMGVSIKRPKKKLKKRKQLYSTDSAIADLNSTAVSDVNVFEQVLPHKKRKLVKKNKILDSSTKSIDTGISIESEVPKTVILKKRRKLKVVASTANEDSDLGDTPRKRLKKLKKKASV